MQKLIGKNKTVVSIVMVVAVAAALALPQAVMAINPPAWLPGQPLLAGNQIIAMWLPVPGAVKYVVYLNGEKIAELPTNQYMGLAPKKAGDNKFEVTAIDASGAESPRSNPGVIKIVFLEPPTGLINRMNADEGTVNIRWKPGAGAVFSNIYKAESKDGPWTLLESVQSDSHKDSGLELNKEYFYAISGKDVSGKESAKSSPMMVKLVEQAQTGSASVKINMVMKTVKSFQTKRAVGPLPIDDIGYLKQGADGDVWIVRRSNGRVYRLSQDGEIISNINITQAIKTAGHDKWSLAKYLVVSEDGLFAVSDPVAGMIALFEEDGNLLWVGTAQFPPNDEEHKPIWDNVGDPVQVIRAAPRPSQLLFKDLDTIWVADNRATIIYEFDAGDGELIGWWAGFVDARGEKPKPKLMGKVSEMYKLDDSTIVLSQSFSHQAVVIDPESKEIKYILGEKHEGYKGGFLTVNAYTKMPDNNLLVVDAGVGTLQVFDPATGEYLYHLAGTEAKPDPELGGQRPFLGYGAFTNPYFEGSTLWITDSRKKIIIGYGL